MKKTIALALSALLILSTVMLSGCTKTPQNKPSDDISDNDSVNADFPSPDNGESENKTEPDNPDADRNMDGASDDPTDGPTDDPTDGLSDNVADGLSDGPTDNEKFDIALSMIGEKVGALYEAIGEPVDFSYASSCMGKGEDGELYYDGFTVCTYLENGVETVVDVYK